MICDSCAEKIRSGGIEPPSEDHSMPRRNPPPWESTAAFSATVPQDHSEGVTGDSSPDVPDRAEPRDSSFCHHCGDRIRTSSEFTRPPRRRLFPKERNAPIAPGDPLQDLAIHFDIDKLVDPSYGEAAWRIFWTIIDIRDLPPFTTFHEGDTDWTLQQNGIDNTYCIRVRSNQPHVLAAIRDAFWDSGEFSHPVRGVKALWPFQVDEDAERQPLVEAGYVSFDHELKGACYLSKSALESVDGTPVHLDRLFHEAMAIYRSSQPPYDPDSLGLPCFDQGRLRAAYEMFDELLSALPLDPEGLLMRAQCAHDLGNPAIEPAIADVETVLEMNPCEARAYDLLAGLLYRKFINENEKKANELALLNLKKVLEIDPDYSSDTGYRLSTRTTTNRAFRENIAGHEKVLDELRR